MEDDNEIFIPPVFAVEDFAKRIPGNRGMPLTQDGKYDPMDIGRIEDLPPSVQQIIEQIKTADSVAEKAAIAHSFTLVYIKPEMQFGSGFGEERKISFQDLARDPIGDCDDYMHFNAALLLHGGVNPRDLFLMTGIMEYEIEKNVTEASHAFLVVKDGEKHLLLDNNLSDVPEIVPERPIVRGRPFTGGLDILDFLKDSEIKAQILFLSEAANARGTNFNNEEAHNKFVEAGEQFIQALTHQPPVNNLRQNASEPTNIQPSSPAVKNTIINAF